MPPKEIKVPVEPPSGKGAELTPSPEPEAVNVEAEAGVRPIGDPGLLRTVSEFRAAIGVEAPPPTPEKSDAWRVGLEKSWICCNCKIWHWSWRFLPRLSWDSLRTPWSGYFSATRRRLVLS